MLNVSVDTVQRAKKVLASDDRDLIAAVERGEVKASAAAKAVAAAPRVAAPVRKRELHHAVSLAEWKELGEAERRRLLSPDQAWGFTGFNRQTNGAVDWAKWTWNPVSGCEHECIYCYARDMATIGPTSSGFPFGFQPTLYPRRLLAPSRQTVPQSAASDVSQRNVFTCSMADLFGRWVPDE
jgi:hypothetical protein